MFFIKNKKRINILLSTVFIICSLFLFVPKQVFAVVGFADTVEEIATNLYTNLETTVLENSQWIKESILDGIKFAIINTMIEKIADATVDWINNGFEGGPGFITNFDDFLTDIADQTLGDFISGSPLAFLCSPFSLDIKIALTLQFGGERKARCTLSDVFDNVDNALEDLGNDWSWSKWGNITQKHNNIYGAYADAYADLTLRMAEAKDKTITKSNWGGGMLEFRHCEKGKDVSECDENGENCIEWYEAGVCTTKTPGSLIQDTLGDTLMIGNQRLIIADEINEIVGALLNQLFKSVLGDVGLLGSTPGKTYGFSKLPPSTVKNFRDVIEATINVEGGYLSWKESSLSAVNLAETYLMALIDCWNSYVYTKVNPDVVILTHSQVEEKIEAIQSIIDTQITPLKNRLTPDTETAGQNIEILRGLITEVDIATDENGEVDASIISDISDRLNNLENLHTTMDVKSAEQEFDFEIQPTTGRIISDVLTEKATCEAGGGTFTDPQS